MLSSVCVQEGWKGKVWSGRKGLDWWMERVEFQIFPEHLPRLARTGITGESGCARPFIHMWGWIPSKTFMFQFPGSLSEPWGETVLNQACVIPIFVPLPGPWGGGWGGGGGGSSHPASLVWFATRTTPGSQARGETWSRTFICLQGIRISEKKVALT